MADPLYESIRPRTRRMGRSLVHVEACGSTMDEVRRLAESGAPDGTVMVADRQTAGRGRREHTWFSPRGAMLATLLVRPRIPPAQLALVPLMAAHSLVRSIARLTRVAATIKWPNDVWIDGRKVAGVLVDARSQGPSVEWALVGIGVNVDIRDHEFPDELRGLATSLSMEAGRHVCAPALLKLWLESFEASLDQLEHGFASAIVHDAQTHLEGLDRKIRGRTPDGMVEGTAIRLGPLGELVLKTDAGERWLREGEVDIVRPL